MTDEQFVKAFESGDLPPAQFRHSDHLRLAWYYGSRLGFKETANKVAEGIKRFAHKNNVGNLYHETITMFWISEICRMLPSCTAGTFDEFAAQNPSLRDKTYIYRFYSEELLKSEEAKRNWVEADLYKRESTASTILSS